MDFSPTEEQRQLREVARRFARGEMAEVAREIEAEDRPLDRSWIKRYAEMGFLGINVAPAYGGLGLGNLEALMVLEAFAQVSPAVAFPIFESSVGPVRAIEHFAGEELRQRVVPRVCAGEIVVAVAMSEPEAGSALTDLKTRARFDGDRIVLDDGQKRWCTGGGHADGYVVYCRLADAPGAKGIGAVYVEKDRPGLSFGAAERLMGFRGLPSADIFFDNVAVPRDNLIVEAGGFRRMMQSFDLERCGNATMCVGIAAAALEEALAYTQERRQFGKPICEFQAVQLKLAEMAMQVDAARLLVHRAAQESQSGLPSVLHSSLGKCFANQMVREVAGTAMQLMGAYGYSTAYRMEQRLRDA